jgi:predicted extracellular nuclease
MSRFRLVAAGLLGVGSLALPATASAAPAVQFGVIQYDSPGTDDGSNASLNAEFVVVKNVSGRKVQLEGFTVRDASGRTFTFPAMRLRPGRTVRLHTGTGTNTARHVYWRQSNYVWNNGGDTATLRNAAGKVIDRCAWTSTGTGTISCP